MDKNLETMLEDAVAESMVDAFVTRLGPSRKKSGMIVVFPNELTTFVKAVIEVTVDTTMDAIPNVIEDAVRRMENANNDSR